MKKIHYVLYAIMMTVILSASSREVYAKGGGYHRPHRVCAEIQADKARIAEDQKIIRADKQVLNEAKRFRDKVKIKQAHDKLRLDIQQYKKDKVTLAKCED